MSLKTHIFKTRGIGVVTTAYIVKDTRIGIYLETTPKGTNIRRHIYNGWFETPLLGRYVNHSNTPNCTPLLLKSNILLNSICNILPNQEITINYFDIVSLINLPESELIRHGIKHFEYIEEKVDLFNSKLL